MKRWLCVAGETSGDQLLAPLLPHLGEAFGVGGPASVAAGLEALAGPDTLAAHGFGEALSTLPAFLTVWRKLHARLGEAHGLVLVDFPELNGRLAAAAQCRGIPVTRLAPPQAWAWRSHRAKGLRRADFVGCLLPFAAEWYRARGVAAEWIGHPLAERAKLARPDTPAIALLPGSRESTALRLLPALVSAAEALGVPAFIGRAPHVSRSALAAFGLPVLEGADAALARSTVAVAGAGTATLHAALAGRPVLTVAALGGSSAWLMRRLLEVEHLGLPNLVMGRRAFPELHQEEVSAARVAAALEPLLEGGRWDGALQELAWRMRHPSPLPFAERVAGRIRGCQSAT